MRPLIVAFCAAALCVATPAMAALQLVAPEAVRELLERHLTMAESADDAPPGTQEHRLRREATELLATEGYFSPQITLRYTGTTAVLHVEPGSRARIGNVQIEIRGPLAGERREQLIRTWALPRGEFFQQSAWDDAKRRLQLELSATDYADSRLLSSRAEVDIDAARVDLRLVLDTGPRYRYGEVRIVGLQRYPPTLVQRYNERVQPGGFYRHDDLLALQSSLQNTPYFSSVSVELETNARLAETGVAEAAPEDTDSASPATTNRSDESIGVPVVVRVVERAPYSVALGAGASSNTGARVEVGFSSADFLSRGLALNTGARIEQLRQNVYADIFFPPDAKKRRHSIGSTFERSDIQGLRIESAGLAALRTQAVGKIERSLGVNLRRERQWPKDAPPSTSQALAATVGWTWRHANDLRDPGEGVVAQVQLAGAAKALLSDQNFLRTYLRYSQGFTLDNRNSLLLRGEVGITAAPSRQGIPQDYLFRAGGANSLRGYDYQSLGVKEGSATVGGRYLVTLSAEYTRWIDEKWGIATFIDAGQAADDRDLFTLRQGYGLGARWKSPAGPLAADIAWGELDTHPHLHFSLAIPF